MPRESSPARAGQPASAQQASAQLCFGRVMHRRLRPVEHTFNYASYSLRLKLNGLDEISARGFSLNRFNLLSFYDADHGDGKGALAWARALLTERGIAADGDIWLTTYPRVLGYAFKPVSFWHCHRADGTLVAILAEVNNTFGERHVYLLRPDAPLATEKVFHVSPFFPVRGRYQFAFELDAERFRARVDYDEDGDPLLRTAWWGELVPLTTRSTLRAFFTYPLMTLAVIVRIHIQALRLYLRRVPFFSKPALPRHEVTE